MPLVQRKPAAINDLYPFAAVYTINTAVQSDRGAGKSGDERMALTGRNAETPRGGCPNYYCKECSTECRSCLVGICAEVDHVVNGHCDF